MAAPQASSRLEMLQARFQQRQLLEKEQKLLQLYDQQQLRAHQVAQRGSAGSNGSNSPGHGSGGTATHHQTVTRTTTTTQSTSNSQGGGKVRQMFDERRQTTVKGIDKSYPLEPLDNRSRKQQSTTGTTSNVSVSSTSPMKNGNPMSNRQTVVTRRTVRSKADSNVNGGKPIVSYHEEVRRETCGPTERANEQEEFGDENDQVSRYANGNPQIDQRSEVHIENVTNENTTQRHRTTAKIHLAAFDNGNGTYRNDDDLDNEQFLDDAVNVPDRLPRRAPVTKKPTQAEARLERFKNLNAKKPIKTTKQVAGNTTSFTKKRTETTTHSGSSSRASTMTRTMEEETSRASSTSPELVRAERPRSSSPEVADREKKSTSPVDGKSSATKSSCISKVSQLTHRSSMDFYPRRKSEFEKSKTFRKLQLELGESSPEPAEPEEEPVVYSKQCRKRSSLLESNVYSPGRRSSSLSPISDRDDFKGRKSSREQTPESRKDSENPVYRGKSITTSEESKKTETKNIESYSSGCRSSSNQTTDREFLKERKTSREKCPEFPRSRKESESPCFGRITSVTDKDTKKSNLESSTYSSRPRSTSSRQTIDHDNLKDRIVGRDKSPELLKGSERSFDGRKSSVTNEDTKKLHFEISTYSSRCHSSSAYETKDHDNLKLRKASREKSPEFTQSRSESPFFGRKSSITSEDTKKSHFEESTYSSRRRSSSSSPIRNRDLPEERPASREKSPESPQCRRRFESPFYGSKSTSATEDIKKSNVQSTSYSLRRRSSSTSPCGDRDVLKFRRTSHEFSPERPLSRRSSNSPVYQTKSTVTTEETSRTSGGNKISSKQTRVTKEESSRRTEGSTCLPVTRKRSESPRGNFRRSSTDRKDSKVATDNRKKSVGTLRSVELVKKLTRPSSSETKTTTRTSTERKTTLEDVEFPVHSVKTNEAMKRSKSPEHKVVKKDKAVMKPSKGEPKPNIRKNSSDTSGKTLTSRSRTVSPSPTSSRTMKETASFRAKKTERRISVESDKSNSKHLQEEKKIQETNKINVRPVKRDEVPKTRSPSPDDVGKNSSRKSSSETTVKRHDTFKVNKPRQRTIEIESSVDTDEESLHKTVKEDPKNKSQLLERIEKIRTTLSRSGRSEQDLLSKDFERTDSVESALRRFDSIGVETEHQITVGVDETDIYPVINQSPYKETVTRKTVTKNSVDSRIKPETTTAAVVKAQPRKIDTKARTPSKEKLSTLRSTKVEKEKSVTTPRKIENSITPKSRPSQKITRSLVRKSKLRGDEPSGRGEGKESDRSPLCKRRLFEDSESEIETDNSRSTVVLSTIIKVSKSPEIFTKDKLRDNIKAVSSDNMIHSQSCITESKTEFEQPTKVLRSIEDIRKSINRESQDFKRELNKFNMAMKRDEDDNRSLECPDSTVTTSGVISRVQITKTMKSGDEAPVIKIERSTVKLPITHRVAKSPSPDIGTKRFIDGRARTPTVSVRRSVPSSPAKSPVSTVRYVSTELKSPGSRPLPRPSTSPSSLREERNRLESSRTSEYSDCTDGPGSNFHSTTTEIVSSIVTKKNDDFPVEFDDDESTRTKDNASSKLSVRKPTIERSLTSQKQQRSPTGTPLPRPSSALSTASSTGSARGQISQNKSRMSTKTKAPTAPKGPPGSARESNAPAVNDGLAPCKICGRRFNSDRIPLHEQICSKTATKKRKQFDATTHRVKGTELEPFVLKKGASKKPQADRKAQKPEVKSNWRRKHEDFINAIRSAKQVQAHLAAGGKLSDLPPPPASDTSDYVQCPHCGRKFNQGAAERHIPKCQNMLHNKPNPRAPPKPKR